MKMKLARTTIKAKPKVIELEKIEEQLPNKSILYFDKENTHKDIMAMIEHFEEQRVQCLYERD